MTADSILISLIAVTLIATVLTIALGYSVGKWRGAIFLCSLLLIATVICSIGILLGLPGLLVEIAYVTMTLAAAFGYFMSKWMGSIVLFALSAVAAAICFVGARFLGMLGLIVAMSAVALLAYLVIRKLSSQRPAKVVSLMWTGWCVSCLFGVGVAGSFGFLLITLPSLALFWLGIYFLAQKSLPLNDNPPAADRLRAFRALLTYTLGTNYPYYAVENQKLVTRVRGNSFRQFFAGPGIVITGCDHMVVTTDGIKIKGVKEPGLSFTGGFEREPIVVDLRCQLRAFHVEAPTKDGIRIKVLTFVPFRIQADGWPEQGKPFPFRKKAVVDAILARAVEHTQEAKDGKVVENKKPLEWDENVQIVATRAVRRIIGDYTFDDLCAPYDPERDPRSEIVSGLQRELRRELGPMGIQALGGGISNLLPEDRQLLQRRIGNWQAEWSRRVSAEMGRADADYIRMVEAARAQTQAEMIRTISEGFERAGPVEDVSKVIALRFIEAIEKMIENSIVHNALPPSSVATVEAMKHAVEAKSH
jgi:regulator of protease activity HflC (stomatin/prohibitin superfamily)